MHKLNYERKYGPVPPGLQLDHLCRVRNCVNPDHVEPVTPAENIRRSPRAKLDEAKVRAIRASTETLVVLAARYGVHISMISAIRNGKKWRLPDDASR